MVDVNCENVPPRVLDMLMTFLAASSRGDQAVLILETKKMMLTTKYRSVELVAGAPACTSTSTVNKRGNPARARRSKLRLEEFQKKKMREKNLVDTDPQFGEQLHSQAAQVTGDTSSKPNQLLLSLDELTGKQIETRLTSPIPQVDGGDTEQMKEEDFYTFQSEYREEDILSSLEEIFPPEKVASLVSRKKVELFDGSPDHLCTVQLRPVQEKTSTWPVLSPSQAEVLRNIKKKI